MPIYGGEAPAEQCHRLGPAHGRRRCAPAAATQPVSIGDGAWGIEVTGRGQRLLRARTWPRSSTSSARTSTAMERDLVRQHHDAAFICELAGTYGRPVVLEEFGLLLRLRLRRERRPLLPAGAAQHPARPGRPAGSAGTTPTTTSSDQAAVQPPPVRAALRPDRRRRHAEAAAGGDAALRPYARRPRPGRLRARRGRRGARRAVRTSTPRFPFTAEADRYVRLRHAPAGVRRRPARPTWPSASPGRATASRRTRGCTCVPSAKQLTGAGLAAAGGARRGRRHACTSPTARARTARSAARGTPT